MFDYNAFEDAVIQANRELYEYINTHISSLDYEESNTLGFGGDNSLNIDLKAEQIFIKYLENFGDIYSEEVGLLSSNSNIKIVIDPIDGSHNFMSQLPYYSTSVALKIDEEYQAGFICNLANGTLLYKINKIKKNIDLLSLENIPLHEINKPVISVFERAYAYPKICEKLIEEKIKFRSPGSVALSLANARNYKFVIFAGKIREFDIAASMYINDDLFTHIDEEFLIVAKSKYYFDLVKEFIKE